MRSTDKPRTLTKAQALDGHWLRLIWSDGSEADIDLAQTLSKQPFVVLRDPAQFATVKVGDWGHSIEWNCGIDMGADSLWLETLSANGKNDVRRFLEWRLHNGLSLSEAGKALGISRRSVAYYSNGERPIPKAILLACTGWEVDQNLMKAA